MDIDVHLYFNGKKIGVINHQYVYDDEANSGREICEGCLLVLNDFKYRVEKVEKKSDGYHAYLIKSWEMKKECLKINDLIINIANENGQSFIRVQTKAEGDNLKYAWYVLKDGKKIHTEWYSEKSEMVYEVKSSGEHQLIAFIKDEFNEIKQKMSDYIYI